MARGTNPGPMLWLGTYSLLYGIIQTLGDCAWPSVNANYEPNLLRWHMPLSDPEPQLEKLEKQLRERLGRELTAREKFYVALSEACNPLSTEGLGELDV